MKTFLMIIILCSFLQSAFLGINLVLVFIIARSLATDDKSNLYLAFVGGISLSFLTQVNLGYWPLILLLVSKITSAARFLPVSLNPLMIFLVGGVQIVLVAVANMLISGSELKFLNIILEAVLVIAAFYLARAWDERFVVKREIKLRI